MPTALRFFRRQWKHLSVAVVAAAAVALRRECSHRAATSGRPLVRNFPPPVRNQCRRSQRRLPLLVLMLVPTLPTPRRAALGDEAALAAALVAVRVVLVSAAVRWRSMPRMRLGPRRLFAVLLRHRPDTFSTAAATAVRRPRPRRNRGARRITASMPMRIRERLRPLQRIQCSPRHLRLPPRRSPHRRRQCFAAAAERMRPSPRMPLPRVCPNNSLHEHRFRSAPKMRVPHCRYEIATEASHRPQGSGVLPVSLALTMSRYPHLCRLLIRLTSRHHRRRRRRRREDCNRMRQHRHRKRQYLRVQPPHRRW